MFLLSLLVQCAKREVHLKRPCFDLLPDDGLTAYSDKRPKRIKYVTLLRKVHVG